MNAPIVRSLLDTDLYKLTMWQALFHAWPANRAEYRFVCRNRTAFPLAELRPEVEAELHRLCALRFTEEELAYLGTKRYLTSDFVDFLRIFHFQDRYLQVRADGDALEVVALGPQIHVMGFEIFVLAIVNELYGRRFDGAALRAEGQRRLDAKIERLAAERPARATPFELSDFGTRRRHSYDWHDHVVATLKARAAPWFRGTSNVHLAMKHGLVTIGTMAHEYLQTFQAVGVQLRNFQKAALEAWVQEYRGDLGIALTDVVGMDAFLADFDLYFAKLFDGLRHDSGDPYAWGEQAIAHYERLRIRPMTKRLVFSDGLDLPRALAIHSRFADRIPCGFGIGTNLTNDLGIEPPNVVMKLVAVNGQPVAKLSDSPGKTLCDDATFLAYLRQVFGRA